jgi:D-tyrosyl-tRNA(Tyr) deacylase
MRAVIQRVRQASVTIGDDRRNIERGLVILIGVKSGDTEADAKYLAEKIVNLRIFEDEGGKFNLSVKEIGGSVLAVSNFTLYGDCRKGRRPSFTDAAPAEVANALYEKFVEFLKNEGVSTRTGVFQARMLVSIENDGPVTVLLDSERTF